MTMQNMKKIDAAVQKFSKCKFGTAQDRLDTANEAANLIETLFAYGKRPCRELALTQQLMKFCHLGEQTAKTEKEEKHSNLLKTFQSLLSGGMEIHF